MTEIPGINTIPIALLLEQTDLDSQLRSLKDNPNILIKELPHPEPDWTLEEVEQEVSTAQKLIGELPRFSIDVPKFGFFIGRDNGTLTTYCKRERIEGVSLWKFAKTDRLKAREVLPQFFSNVTTYLTQCYIEKKPYLNDIFGPEQYIYGKSPSRQGEKVYLVDIDPYFYNSFNPNHEDLEEEAIFFTTLDEWCKEMVGFENQLEMIFTDVRKLLDEFYSGLPPHSIPFELSGFDRMRTSKDVESTLLHT